MRKTLIAGVAAVTAAIGMLSAGGASARDYGRYGYYGGDRYYSHRHRDRDGDALAAGIVGLALGAAIASGNDGRRYSYYDRGYYEPRGYYVDRGYYGRPYRSCRTVRVYDPYYGRAYERRCW